MIAEQPMMPLCALFSRSIAGWVNLLVKILTRQSFYTTLVMFCQGQSPLWRGGRLLFVASLRNARSYHMCAGGRQNSLFITLVISCQTQALDIGQEYQEYQWGYGMARSSVKRRASTTVVRSRLSASKRGSASRARSAYAPSEVATMAPMPNAAVIP